MYIVYLFIKTSSITTILQHSNYFRSQSLATIFSNWKSYYVSSHTDTNLSLRSMTAPLASTIVQRVSKQSSSVFSQCLYKFVMTLTKYGDTGYFHFRWKRVWIFLRASFFEAGLIESNGVPMTRRYGLGPLPFRAEHLKRNGDSMLSLWFLLFNLNLNVEQFSC